jgi:hypothetical protein
MVAPAELSRDSWAEAWGLAVKLAAEDLAARDLAECCRKSGAVWDGDRQVVQVTFLGETYETSAPDFQMRRDGSGEEVDIRERILLLHYLQTAGGSALKGDWIAFSQMPGAELYLGNFRARSADRIGRAFGQEPAQLVGAARALGGVETDLGDAGVRLEALPRVPVQILVWGGDDEFPASGDVLFDASVTDYLPLEDVIVTAEKVATRLCNP